jgi:hypothetical protein
MDLKVVAYSIYLVISVLLTLWVGRTLFRNGQVFLDEALGNEHLARSVNHLLVVGFYLLNLGYVTIGLKINSAIDTASVAFEALSWKLGLVLLVLGVVHFFNVYVLSRFRRRRLMELAPPPIPPSYRVPANPRPQP